MEEFKCCLCDYEPPRLGRNLYGKTNKPGGFQVFIPEQADDTDDLRALLAKHKPRIVVDEESGG